MITGPVVMGRTLTWGLGSSMPVTPYHLGPGAALKALAPRTFSFAVFGLTQVVIDLETLYNVIRQSEVLHRHLHTYAGATVVAVVGTVLGRPLSIAGLRAWNATVGRERTGLLRVDSSVSWKSAAISASIGAYSHIVFDSMMHRDIRPWAPWSEANGLLEIIPVVALHWLCLAMGIGGAAVMTARRTRSGTPESV